MYTDSTKQVTQNPTTLLISNTYLFPNTFLFFHLLTEVPFPCFLYDNFLYFLFLLFYVLLAFGGLQLIVLLQKKKRQLSSKYTRKWSCCCTQESPRLRSRKSVWGMITIKIIKLYLIQVLKKTDEAKCNRVGFQQNNLWQTGNRRRF